MDSLTSARLTAFEPMSHIVNDASTHVICEIQQQSILFTRFVVSTGGDCFFDALVEPEEVARAFDEFEAAGKVRAFGVSNHTPRQIDLLKTAVKQPLHVNQVQFSITHSSLVAQGMTSNMTTSDDAFTRDGGGLVDYARVNKITLQAWSPIQIGHEPGIFLGSLDYPELNAEIEGAVANRNSR